MLIDGRGIAGGVYARLRERVSVLGFSPVLAIVTCSPNFETKKYLALKEKKAREVGIETRLIELPAESTTEDFIRAIEGAVAYSSGIIVQLPLPPGVDVDAVLRSIPPSHDVDGLNPENQEVLSPVAGAIAEILSTHSIAPFEKHVTVIGNGRLVGFPAYRWFSERGSHLSVVTKDTADIAAYTKTADIIVCGAGVPNLLTPEMVREGVVILDAGTSEQGGELRGDADPRCAEKAGLFTPVPGGIGPLTIAILLENVVSCAEKNRPVV